ncbi:4'-phosphopantetheinyl transferase superfamily protein [Virgibacillus oceani]
MTEIIALQIPEALEQQDYNFLASCISDSRLKQLSRFIHMEDVYRSLFAESLARAVIINKLHMENRDIHFGSNTYGKPYLSGQSNFHFNLSHSGSWVVMIWGEDPVGIDIEKVKKIDIGVAARFFSSEEYMDIMSKPEYEQRDFFYALWTLKESYIKALGTGLSMPLDSFGIRILEEKITLTGARAQCLFKQYEIALEYKLSACTFTNELPKYVQHYLFKSLISELKQKV